MKLGTEFKVGLFTIIGLVVIIYLFIALKPGMFSGVKTVTYFTYLDDASGLYNKTNVKTNGVTIGKVKDVILDVNRTKVILEVDSTIKIPVKSTLEVKRVGLLGDSHIEIHRSEDTGTYLEDGGFIPRIDVGTDLNALLEVANDVARDIKEITSSLKQSFGGEEGTRRVADIANDLNSITANLRGILEDNRADVRSLVAQINEVSISLKDIFREQNKEKIDQIIASVSSSMRNIELVAEKVEKGEGTIGKLFNDDKTLVELENAIKDLREVFAPAVKMEVVFDSRMESRRDDSNQVYVDLKLRTRPDRYYLLGLTDHSRKEVEERVKTIPDPDSEGADTTRKTIEEKEALRFNLQFAKRWDFASLRFGLFESTGGVGADFYLWKDRIRFSVEAFDFASGNDSEFRKTAHFKAYARALFFDHLYLTAGIDDPTKYKTAGDKDKYQDLNYFIGAGITFSDRDIKSIIGTAALAL